MFKTKFFLVLLFGLSICGSGIILAQQGTEDQLYWVREEVARVDMWQQYEETSKQWVEMMTGAGLDFPYIRASQRDDGHYYYLIPLSNYADIDKFPEIFGSAIDKIGKEKWDDFMIENEASIETHKDFIVRWSAKHSYVPKEPRVKIEDAEFIHWVFFTFKLEKRKEVLNILAEWKELYEKNNMFAISEIAKDGAGFYAAMKENSEKLKDEEEKLWAKFSANVISIEQKFGKPRPDLGFVKK